MQRCKSKVTLKQVLSVISISLAGNHLEPLIFTMRKESHIFSIRQEKQRTVSLEWTTPY